MVGILLAILGAPKQPRFVVDVVVPFFFSYVSSDGKEVVSLRRIV